MAYLQTAYAKSSDSLRVSKRLGRSLCEALYLYAVVYASRLREAPSKHCRCCDLPADYSVRARACILLSQRLLIC